MATRDTRSETGGKFVMNAGDRAYKAKDLIGARIVDRYGEYLGKVQELAIQPQDGRITFLIISRGGFLGVGEKFIPIPFSALSMKTDQSGREIAFVLDMETNQLDSAPSLEGHSWGNLSNRQWVETVYSYYGKRPFWKMDEDFHTTSMSEEIKTTSKGN
ncbi:MAG TPA: PRC-barrel domain-containing protein [Thermodesulfobacteriota bacterium]|nr:PRC-barrel domain-containing protein [Thermodesulfobacteriota bacterium]